MKEYRVVLVGGQNTFKSELIRAFIPDHYIDKYDPLLELSYRKECVIDEETCLISAIDAGDLETSSVMFNQYVKKAHVVILCYNLSLRFSFDEIAILRERILRVKDADIAPMVLVEMDCCCEHTRAVSVVEGRYLAKAFNNIPFLRVSPTNGQNVNEIFKQAIREVQKDTMTKSQLYSAIMSDNLKKFKQACAENFDYFSYLNLTPLHIVAMQNKSKICKFLLSQSVIIDAIDCEIHTPLYYAVQANHQKISRLLLEKNATIFMPILGLALKYSRSVVLKEASKITEFKRIQPIYNQKADEGKKEIILALENSDEEKLNELLSPEEPPLAPQSIFEQPESSPVTPTSAEKQAIIEYTIVLTGDKDTYRHRLALSRVFICKDSEIEDDPTKENAYRKYCVIDGNNYMLHILNGAGLEDYSCNRDSYICSGNALILCYNFEKKSSYEEATSIREQIHRSKDSKTVPMVLAAMDCKYDHKRSVSVVEGRYLAKSFDIPFLEVSPDSDVNVTEIFELAVREIRKEEVREIRELISILQDLSSTTDAKSVAIQHLNELKNPTVLPELYKGAVAN